MWSKLGVTCIGTGSLQLLMHVQWTASPDACGLAVDIECLLENGEQSMLDSSVGCFLQHVSESVDALG